MADRVVGKIPDFTTDDTSTVTSGEAEVKEATVPLDTVEQGKENPAEPPSEEKPSGSEEQKESHVEYEDTLGELKRAIAGLEKDRANLLKEVSSLKGTKRELKREELSKVQEQIDDLQDIAPEDQKLIERVLRQKGFVTRQETDLMLKKAVKQEELRKFLDKYPEYKEENDPEGTHWTALQREFDWYVDPEDPYKYGEVLEKVHQNIARFSNTNRSISVKKRQLEVAGAGSSGGSQQRAASQTSGLTEKQKAIFEAGGWSPEDIKRMEGK